MRIAIFDGTTADDRAGAAAATVLERAVAARRWGAHRLVLRDLDLPHCLGCFECWVHTPGECVAKGDCDRVARTFIDSDIVVLLTRVTFGGYSSHLKRALDHTMCLVSPSFTVIDGEVHHKRRYARYPSLVGIGLIEGGTDEQRAIFEALVVRNAINSHAPRHAALVLATGDEQEMHAKMSAALGAAGGVS